MQKTVLEKIAEDFVSVIEKHAKYIVVAGFVAIAHGRSRGTEDVDIIIEKITKEKFIIIHEDLKKSGFECMQTEDPVILFEEYLKKGLNIRYHKIGVYIPNIEIKLAKNVLDDLQIKNRKKLEITGLDMYFSPIEAIIAFKEFLASEKDLEDAKHLRLVYKDMIDEGEIERIKSIIRRLEK